MIGDHIIENSYLEEKLGAVVDGPLSGDSHCSAALKKSNVVPKYVCQKKGISVARSGAYAHSVQFLHLSRFPFKCKAEKVSGLI